MLEIIKDIGIHTTKSGYKKRYVIVKCGCGKEFKTTQNAIKTKNTKSCGCGYYKGTPISSDPAYSIWKGIKTRCYNKNRSYYEMYGGRGINVCDEWKNNGRSFIEWAYQNGYKRGLCIDRIDVNGDYEPNNCRFVSPLVSARNKRLLSKANNSGFRGVTKKKQKSGIISWRSRIGIDGVNVSLGVFSTREEAAKAYDKYVIDNNLEFPLNF